MSDEGKIDEEKARPAKRSLRKAVELVSEVKSKDAIDKKEETALATEKISDAQSNRALRERLAGRVYWYLVGYSAGAFMLLVLHGAKYNGFALDKTVLALVVGSTAVSAIGLVGIVVRGLFK